MKKSKFLLVTLILTGLMGCLQQGGPTGTPPSGGSPGGGLLNPGGTISSTSPGSSVGDPLATPSAVGGNPMAATQDPVSSGAISSDTSGTTDTTQVTPPERPPSTAVPSPTNMNALFRIKLIFPSEGFNALPNSADDFVIQADGAIEGDADHYYPSLARLVVSDIHYDHTASVLRFATSHASPNREIPFLRVKGSLSDKSVLLTTHLNLSVRVDHPIRPESTLYQASKEYFLSGDYPHREDGSIQFEEDLGSLELATFVPISSVWISPKNFSIGGGTLNRIQDNIPQQDASPEVIRYPFECLDPNGRWARVPSERRPCRVAKDCPIRDEQIMEKISEINSGHDDYHEADKRELIDYLESRTDEWMNSSRDANEFIRNIHRQMIQLVDAPCHWVPPLDYARYVLFKEKSEQLGHLLINATQGALQKNKKGQLNLKVKQNGFNF